MGSISIDSAAFVDTIIVVALLSLLVTLRWHSGGWRRQLGLGIPVTAALVGLVVLLVDGLALIPYQFPNSYYLWMGLTLLAVAVAAIGWRRPQWTNIAPVVAVVLCSLMAVSLINAHYGYYPTLASLVGKVASHEVDAKQLAAEQARWQGSGKQPDHGLTVHLPIPGVVSGFHARDAYVWVPPVWIADRSVRLPVVELLAGSPGDPSDWTRAGFADSAARDFARAHHGRAPILVMADLNGSGDADTECVDSPIGRAETYLTVDVPRFMRSYLRAADAPMAIVGLSEGGMCSTMLALRHPAEYPTFADFSGLTSPTVGESVDPAATTRALFGGSTAAYRAHDPLVLLAPPARFPASAGFFEVGTADLGPLAAQRQLVPLARAAGIEVCAREVVGAGHDFQFWARAFKRTLPWLAWRLGLAERPLAGEGCAP